MLKKFYGVDEGGLKKNIELIFGSGTNNKYPFIKHRKGYRLSISSYNQYHWVYVYLLLSTRLNMLANKVWRGIDGTEILEELSAIIAKSYFGDRAKSIIFGTVVAGALIKR